MAGRSGKGSQYERAFCKRLSLWWTGGKRDDVFWRSQASGARATQRRKTDKDTFGQSGDVQACDPIGQPLMDVITIELKKGYNNCHPMEPLLTNKKMTTIEKFINQAKTQQTGWSWMLVHKADRMNEIMYVPAYLATAMFSFSKKRPERYSIIQLGAFKTYAIPFDFFLTLPPKKLPLLLQGV